MGIFFWADIADAQMNLIVQPKKLRVFAPLRLCAFAVNCFYD